MAIYRGPGGSGDAVNDSSSETRLAVQARDAALAAQAAAEAAQAAAETAETNAETAETNAETAETNAETAATNAASSASSASTSATNAASSASSASTSATNAASSASSASTSATNAASSASSASSSASSASTSAGNAATSATAAQAAQAAAEAAFDAFDDIYLGAKSSNPTVDNDGNALTTGDQYFNTVSNEMRVWNGSTWQSASVIGGTVTTLSVTGNTTLGDASTDTVTVNANNITTPNGIAINGTTIPSSKTLVVTTDIGSTVQAYDADTTKNDVANTFTANQVISVTDNTNAALRITQLGTGNALVVEDSSNPDSTPFVIDASGNVIIGGTSTTGNEKLLVSSDTSIGYLGASAGSAGSPLRFRRAAGTVSSPSIVSSGDLISTFQFFGYDGTNYIESGRISAAVDGTPGTNDMPGRLVFSTTADGASSPTERMRIDSAGRVGIGGSAQAGDNLYIPKNITGATVSYGVRVQSTIQSDVTDTVRTYQSAVGTAASAFTLTNLAHFQAIQTTIGAGSTVTNQYGFNVASSLTGATNNYGFYGNIASGTGRYNFYAAGTADNYFAGNVGIGTSSPANVLSVFSSSASLASFTRDLATDVSLNISADNDGTILSTGGVHAFRVFTNNTEKMRLDSSGNLLLGKTTNTIGSKLNVNGTLSETVSSTEYLVASQYDIGTAPNKIPLNQYLGSMAYQNKEFISVDSLYSSGNVGIGTASPGRKLDVSDSTTDVAKITTSSVSDSTLLSLQGGSGVRQRFLPVGGTGNYNWQVAASTNVANAFEITPSTASGGSTFSSPAVLITSSGNLGLGVTPSAWASTYTALQVKNFGLMSKNDSSWQYTNAYYDGSNKYVSNGYAGAFDFNGAATGGYAWRIAPSGTAGNAITFTQAMTLDASGNLGIGTTSPAFPLDIQCDANAFGVRLRGRSDNISVLRFVSNNAATIYGQFDVRSTDFRINAVANIPMLFWTNDTERMRITSSGNVLVNLTSTAAYLDGAISSVGVSTAPAICAKLGGSAVATQFVMSAWSPFTTGDNVFHVFGTESTFTQRGSISYNRAGGLVAYNTTSDYRAKTVKGSVENALSRVSLLKPCTGRMNGAEQDIDFFVAHELQEIVPSAVTGVKDELNEDGTPKYQMVDKSALIPLLTAAIQELNAKVTALEAQLNK